MEGGILTNWTGSVQSVPAGHRCLHSCIRRPPGGSCRPAVRPCRLCHVPAPAPARASCRRSVARTALPCQHTARTHARTQTHSHAHRSPAAGHKHRLHCLPFQFLLPECPSPRPFRTQPPKPFSLSSHRRESGRFRPPPPPCPPMLPPISTPFPRLPSLKIEAPQLPHRAQARARPRQRHSELQPRPAAINGEEVGRGRVLGKIGNQ